MFNRLLKRAALSAVMALVPLASVAETLTDALIGAYRHSGLLEQNRALLRAADEDVATAVSALRPIINYSASYTYTDPGQPVRDPLGLIIGDDNISASLGLSAELLLYDFGNTRLGIDAAKETVLATRESLRDVEQTVLLNAVQAFMNVRRAIAFVDLRQNNVRLLTQELRAARDRFEVGEVTRTDVALAESRLAAARSGLASAEGDLQVAREAYRVAIGRYPSVLATPPRAPSIPGSVDAARNIARKGHPSLMQAQRNVTVAEINIARALAAMKPSLRATGRLTFDEDFDNSSSIGVQLSGPIYQGGRLSALYRRAQAQRDAQRGVLHLTRHNIDQGVGNAWSSLAVAQASLEASDRQVRASTVAFRGVQEEATLGARTTLEVLDAEQELLDARAARISAEIDRYVAVYVLLDAMGLLTVEHLKLGITTYDPAAYYNAVRSAPTRQVSPQGERLDSVLKALGKN